MINHIKPNFLIVLEKKFNHKVKIKFKEQEEKAYVIKEKNCMFIKNELKGAQLIIPIAHEFFHLLIPKDMTDKVLVLLKDNKIEYKKTKTGRIEEKIVEYVTYDYILKNNSHRHEKLNNIKLKLEELFNKFQLNFNINSIIGKSPYSKNMFEELIAQLSS